MARFRDFIVGGAGTGRAHFRQICDVRETRGVASVQPVRPEPDRLFLGDIHLLSFGRICHNFCYGQNPRRSQHSDLL